MSPDMAFRLLGLPAADNAGSHLLFAETTRLQRAQVVPTHGHLPARAGGPAE